MSKESSNLNTGAEGSRGAEGAVREGVEGAAGGGSRR